MAISKWEQFLSALPNRYKEIFHEQISSQNEICEVRFRVNRAITLIADNTVFYLGSNGVLTKNAPEAITTSQEDIIDLYQQFCEYSTYAYENEIAKGYLTLKGGNRMGIAGTVLYREDKMVSILYPNALNIRIAKEHIGIGEKIFPYLIRNNGLPYSTLIASPPGYGKTSLLRDLVRLFATSSKDTGWKGIDVSLIDERSEVASCFHGVPQNQIGQMTDIFDRISKRDGLRMGLRIMSPKMIAVDEIGDTDDLDAINEISYSGCSILATVHIETIEDVFRNQFLKKCHSLFERLIIIKKEHDMNLYKLPDGKLISDFL